MPRARVAPEKRVRNVVPDRLDLRDRVYLPPVTKPPLAKLNAFKLHRVPVRVHNQESTNACTGFGLAAVADFVLHRAGRKAEAPVSPFFFYSMARRYDEFPGATEDSGSSCRGAMKGWFKHGAAGDALFPKEKMPPPAKSPDKDWWLDAARRPLGAYYRVDTRSVTDMHAALNDVGILYASAVCHGGWDEGSRLSPAQARGWRIPCRKATPADGGHAFAIVGYDEHGFLILNSWGTDWGDGGFATLGYEDWVENAMDCWVAQLGVVTEQHREIASSLSLRATSGPEGVRLSLSSSAELRNREISPFVIDMENNGMLSRSGQFRTSEDDLRALFTIHLPQARKVWEIGASDPVDIALYAHGGLTDENTAADTAARWIPALYEARVFPIFLMWETDIWSTIRNRLADLVREAPRPTGGLRDDMSRWWNERLERLLAEPGSAIWGEMKQNAEAITANKESGVRKFYEICRSTKGFRPASMRLHLIGHSAGAIVHSYVADALAKLGWRFETVSFMAPAVTVETFDRRVLPHLKAGRIGHYHQFHLTDAMEQKDVTCRAVLGYGRSLLYLVSESFEHGVRTPILGMEKYFAADAKLGAVKERVTAWAAPSSDTASTTHGGFDDDAATMRKIVALIAR